jgi:hypothetical protein
VACDTAEAQLVIRGAGEFTVEVHNNGSVPVVLDKG